MARLNLIKLFKQGSILEKCSLILCVALLACLLPLPYGYYTLVRFATAIIIGCWAYKFYQVHNMPMLVTSVAIVLLFQPFFKIVLDRTTWNIVDILLAISLSVYCYRHLVTK
jgi:membrane protein implicated in regulation of membrane protease activity